MSSPKHNGVLFGFGSRGYRRGRGNRCISGYRKGRGRHRSHGNRGSHRSPGSRSSRRGPGYYGRHGSRSIRGGHVEAVVQNRGYLPAQRRNLSSDYEPCVFVEQPGPSNKIVRLEKNQKQILPSWDEEYMEDFEIQDIPWGLYQEELGAFPHPGTPDADTVPNSPNSLDSDPNRLSTLTNLALMAKTPKKREKKRDVDSDDE